jgi:colicin import membrane protein
MENRSLSLAARLIILFALSCPALAAESGPTPEQQADWQQRIDKASALQKESQTRKAEADRIFEQKNGQCLQKFQVNRCRDQARNEHMVAIREIRRLENEGKALERQVKKEQLAVKDKRNAELAPQRAAGLEVRAAENAELHQSAEAKRAATLADKARKAEEGAQRKAGEAEKQRKKQEEHDARIAKKVEKAERRAEEADAAKK